MTFTYEPFKVVLFLGKIVVCLIVANLAAIIAKHHFNQEHLFGFVPIFHFDYEHNIPTLFSSATLLICAGLLWVIATARKKRRERDYYYWLGLAIIFLFLSIDEAALLHEKLIEPVRALLNISGPFYFAWVIPYAILVVGIGLVYLRFLFNLPSSTRRLTIFAGLVYVTGALGFEVISGLYFTWNNDQIDFIYALITTCEEILEMVGTLVFMYALMSYIDTHFSDLFFRIASSQTISQPLTPGYSERVATRR